MVNEVIKLNKITQSITLDLVEISHNVVNAMQGDRLTRNLVITITDNGKPYQIDTTSYVYLRGKRADGKSVFYLATVTDFENGIIELDIHDYLLSPSGRAKLDIGIYNRVQSNHGNEEDEIASTESFELYIPPNIFNEDDIVNSDDGSVLSQLINSARDEIAEMNVLEDTVSKNESDRNTAEAERASNENSRIDSENIRNANENTRIENETVRKNQEKDRENNTATAISNAEKATKEATDGAKDLQSKLDSHHFVLTEDKDIAGGVPSLDSNAKIPLNELYEATTSTKGITQLTDSITSTSTTTAATPNSVKKVNEELQEEIKRAKNTESDLNSNKADVESATLTGIPTAPTASSGTNTTQIATTAFVQTAVANHNTSNTSHTDIRDLITGLTTRLNALADSDDTTLDQLSEIVAYIKNDKSLIDGITTSKVNVSDIIDNLTSTATNKPLSANQGKVLKGLIDPLTANLSAHKDDTTVHITSAERTNWNSAKTHADSAHARTDATKVEKSTTNGNILINGTETNVYTHPSGTNPHGTTKSDVGLDNVPNVTTNDQTPTFSKSSSRTNISSGEKLSSIFGKIAKWFADLKIVAFSGSYKDLTDKPTIPSVGNGTITITQNGTSKGTFTTNQSGDTIIALTDNNTTYGAAGSSLGLIKSGGDLTITDGVAQVNGSGHTHNYLPLTGGTVTGKTVFEKGIAIKNADENRNMPFFLGIDAFSDGGSVKYINASDVVSAIGAAKVGHTHNYAGSASAGGSAYYADKVWTQSHNGSWYIDSNWNGTWFVTKAKSTSDETLPIWVDASGYANSAGSVAWGNISGTPGTFPPSSHLHPSIEVIDVRGESCTPNYFGIKKVSTFFNNVGMPSADWNSGIHITGWTSDYESWELASSSTSRNTNDSLHFRSGVGTTWNAWRTILDSSNYTSYTVNKTGSGATGNWNINVTGSSKVLANHYSSRQSSINFAQNGSGGVRTFIATTSVTDGKPPSDSNVLHFSWDTTGGWDSQLAVGHGSYPEVYVRGQNAGTWNSWLTCLNSSNYSRFALPKSGGTASKYIAAPFFSGTEKVMEVGAIKISGCAGAIIPGCRNSSDQFIEANGFMTIGTPTYKFSTIYSSKSALNGSDRFIKEQIKSMTADEDEKCDQYMELFDNIDICTFKYRDLNRKEDSLNPFLYEPNRRRHTGVIGQELEDDVVNVGLNEYDFAAVCTDFFAPPERKRAAIFGGYQAPKVVDGTEYSYSDNTYNWKHAGDGTVEKYVWFNEILDKDIADLDIDDWRTDIQYLMIEDNSKLTKNQPPVIINSITLVDMDDNYVSLPLDLGYVANYEPEDSNYENPRSSCELLENGSLKVNFDMMYGNIFLKIAEESIDITKYKRILFDIDYVSEYKMILIPKGNYTTANIWDRVRQDKILYNYSVRYQEIHNLTTYALQETRKEFAAYKEETGRKIEEQANQIKELSDMVKQLISER